jgi:predicted HicB family RNase H-like nuclease
MAERERQAKRRGPGREGMVVLTVPLEPTVHKRLAIAALEENASITRLIQDAVRDWLARRRDK